MVFTVRLKEKPKRKLTKGKFKENVEYKEKKEVKRK